MSMNKWLKTFGRVMMIRTVSADDNGDSYAPLTGSVANDQLVIDSTLYLPFSEGSTSYEQPTHGAWGDSTVSSLSGKNAMRTMAALYGVNIADGTQAVPVHVADNRLQVRETPDDTITTAADEGLTTTSEQILAADTNRKFAIIQNLDASENVRVGDASVGAARGTRVGPGESVTIETTAAIHAVAEAGTPSVSILTVGR